MVALDTLKSNHWILVRRPMATAVRLTVHPVLFVAMSSNDQTLKLTLTPLDIFMLTQSENMNLKSGTTNYDNNKNRTPPKEPKHRLPKGRTHAQGRVDRGL